MVSHMIKNDAFFKSVFGEDYKKESYQMKAHTFNRVIAGKPYCSSCGLVALNNDLTRWCIEQGCYADLHPAYKSAKKRLKGGSND